MKNAIQLLEFDKILNKLENYALTQKAKQRCKELRPILQEVKVKNELLQTTEARKILDEVGNPPLISMQNMDILLQTVKQGGMLLASEIERIGTVLIAVKRLKDFLRRCQPLHVGIAYYSEELEELEELQQEIQNSIRDGYVDERASNTLRDIRRNILILEDKINKKVEECLKSNKTYCSDTFIANKNGYVCIPVKKECRTKIEGTVIDQSQTGATLYIEPKAIHTMMEEKLRLKIEEENEEIRILYTLSAMLAEVIDTFTKNQKIIEELDFIFAKGKLSSDLKAIEPIINIDRYIKIEEGRSPLLEESLCIPMNFELGKEEKKGIIITGPNTGGKTVTIKTVGVFSLMAQCGLHIPCKYANICLNSNILCDIGDGQNVSENLSTFSAHITNILNILEQVNEESLVLLDELGSGTDPTEGMGIAIAILEELRKSECNFVVTTHYPEVKTYAQKNEGVVNARMTFDKETLQPLYQLEIGKAGDSCALFIAEKLGMKRHMLARAKKEAYGIEEKEKVQETKETKKGPRIEKKKEISQIKKRQTDFQIGDSVRIYPEKKLGIVCQLENEKGEILVQVQKRKMLVNQKRVKLVVSAKELYPEGYDFSIIFDTVENRKARHQMSKKHRPDLEIKVEEEEKIENTTRKKRGF